VKTWSVRVHLIEAAVGIVGTFGYLKNIQVTLDIV